ncbi:hypothetical protein niasHT_020011 [Heterodera trifolii]|uniref:Lon proteolytic domain-containing protein n=1 Tax=Heterodera trifolii TaxID=157864 RepID=A0ABD2L5N3_9BILA
MRTMVSAVKIRQNADRSFKETGGKHTKQQLTITSGGGTLDDLARHSVEIAHTFALNFLKGHTSLEKAHVHANIISTSTKAYNSAGPSGGVGAMLAFCSLALQKAVKKGVVATGRITLSGQVLKVGAIKEKIAAAKAGFKIVILPEDNRSLFVALSAEEKKDIYPKWATDFAEIFQYCFEDA